MFKHLPVMSHETLEALALQSGFVVADVTAGGGGHLALLAQAVGPKGCVFALDQDPRAHELDAAGGVACKFPWVRLIQAPFSELPQILKIPFNPPLLKGEEIPPFEKGGPGGILDALLADLGVSSPQLDTAERGLSFKHDGPLDMRMNTHAGITAYELIQHSSEEALANLIYELGEERLSRRIAKSIKAEKNLSNSTVAIANLITRAYRGPRTKIHPATRTFQALRMAVNHELDELKSLLSTLNTVIKPGGRVVIISFHSLEDRLVKNFFKENKQSWRVLHKKPLVPSEAELSENPRSRSAKLRVAERVLR